APKVIVLINATQFSSTRFKDVCRSLNTSLLLSAPNLNGQGEQLVDNVKRQLLVSQREETMEDFLYSKPLRNLYVIIEL
ncbi:unnamed protein product, partial [Hymenolepis diminuta]